jgi:hypothetical protein
MRAHAVREHNLLRLLLRAVAAGPGWASPVGQKVVAGSAGGLERGSIGIEAAGRDLHLPVGR